jgi:hypothetical protein
MASRLALLALCLPLFGVACGGPRGSEISVTAPVARERGYKDETSARMLLVMFGILAIASLSACGIFRAEGSWSDELPDRDASSLAATLTTLVAARIEPGDKPIVLVPARNSAGDRFAVELKSLLEGRGYVLVDEKQNPTNAHRLRYLVTAYSGGYVLRLTLGGTQVGQMIERGPDGVLVANAPLAVREDVR